MTRFDRTLAPTDQRYLWDLARALHGGHSWGEIARALGHPPRAYQAHYRPRVRSYCLRMLDDSGHGTLQRYSEGGCYPDGRRCEPCRAAKADHLRRHRNTSPMRTDPAFLRQLARRLVDGESWDDIAASMDRVACTLHDQVRDLVQPYCLQLVNAEQPPVSHRAHGTNACYVIDRCRCEPCTYARVLYERDRSRKARRGLVPYVDAQPVRDHIAELTEHGIGLKGITRLSGVPHGSLSKLIYGDRTRGLGPSRRVRRRTAERILAVQPLLDHASPGARVPADVTWARVRLLLDKGATKTWIAEQIGYANPTVRVGTPTVTAATARAVRQLHDDVLTGRIAVQGRRSRWDREDVAA